REVRRVVPIRGRAQQAQLDAVGLIAALEVTAARIDVGDVGTELELVGHPVRTVKADGGPLVQVIGALEDPTIAQIGPRQEERRAVVAARHRQRVIGRVAGDVHLVGMVVRRLARETGTPAGPAEKIPHAGRAVAADAAEVGVARRIAERTLTPRALERWALFRALAGVQVPSVQCVGPRLTGLGGLMHEAWPRRRPSPAD